MTTLYSGEYVQFNGTPIIAKQFTVSILSSSTFNSITSSVSGLSGASANSILGPEQIVLVGSTDGYGWVGLTIVSGLTSIWGYLLSYNLSPTITFTVNNTQAYSYYRLIFLSLSPQTFSNNTNRASVAISGFTIIDNNNVPYAVFPTSASSSPTATPSVTSGPTSAPTATPSVTLSPTASPITPLTIYLQLSSYSSSSNSILTYNGTTSVLAYTAPTSSITPSITYQGEYFQYNESAPFILGKMLLGILRPSDFNKVVTNTINTGIYNASPTSILGPDQIVILGSNDSITWTGISSESNLTSVWNSIATPIPSSNTIPTITISTTNSTPYLYYRIVFPRLCSQSFTTTNSMYTNSGIVLSNLSFTDNQTSIIYPIYPQSTTTPIGSSLSYLQYNNYPSNGTVRVYNGLTSTLASFAKITSTAFVTNIENTSPTAPTTIPPTPSPTTLPPGTTPSPTTTPPTPSPTTLPPGTTPSPTTVPIVYPTSPPISTPSPSPPTPSPTTPSPTTPPTPSPTTRPPGTTPSPSPTYTPGPTKGPLLAPALVTQLAIGIIILSIIGLIIILLKKPKTTKK